MKEKKRKARESQSSLSHVAQASTLTKKTTFEWLQVEKFDFEKSAGMSVKTAKKRQKRQSNFSEVFPASA